MAQQFEKEDLRNISFLCPPVNVPKLPKKYMTLDKDGAIE